MDAAVFYFLLNPAAHFGQGKFNFYANIAAYLVARTAAACTATKEGSKEIIIAKNIAKLAENIIHVHAAPAKSSITAKSGVTELIKALSFLSIT